MDIVSYLLGKNSAGGGGGGGSDLDWTALGYAKRPEAIDEDYNYAKQIKENWIPTSSMKEKFQADSKLAIMPLVDTSEVTNFRMAFRTCPRLTTVPVLDTSSANDFGYMFYDTPNLSDESLDNILQMCINASSYTGGKTLRSLSLSSSYYSDERIQALPHYQAFINAGWVISS